MDFEKPLLSTEDVAGYLNVEVVTVRRLISRGELQAYRIGGEYRFAREDLYDYLDRQRVPARVNAERTAEEVAIGATQLPFPVNQFEDLAFTTDAIKALHASIEEAQKLNHPHIGTEHLLLALIHDTNGIAGHVLQSMGVEYMQAYDIVKSIAGPGEELDSEVQLQLSATIRQAFDAAVEATRERKHSYVGTEHLLLGLLQHQGVSAAVLAKLGLAEEGVRSAVLDELGRH